MRYYKLTLTGPNGQPLNLPSLAGSGQGDGVVSSLNSDGTTNPGALNIEIDVTQYQGHLAGGDSRSYVRIWGLALADIARSYSYAGGKSKIKIEAGMAKGYPLADPGQQGTLVQGSIMQAFGNWMGTDMTLDLILGPDASTPTAPSDFSFHQDKDGSLASLVEGVLKKNYPDRKLSITISQDRKAPADLDGSYQTLTQFAQWLYTHTQTPGKDDGVILADDGTTITVTENPNSSKATAGTTANAKQIKFQDLLGQVTWYAPQQVSAKLVMRGDLVPLQLVTFPKGLISTVTAQSMPAFGGTNREQDSLGFAGTYRVIQMQHWGNYRQPDAMAWNTTIWCGPPGGQQSASGSSS